MWILVTFIYAIVAVHRGLCSDPLDCRRAKESQLAVTTGANLSMPDEAVAGEARGMCGLQSSCCSSAVEESLDSYSRNKLSSDVTVTHSYMKRTFARLDEKLEALYTHIIDQSQREALRIFNLVYKEHFQNQHMFDGLYRATKAFYNSPGRGDVKEALQELFDELLVATFAAGHGGGAQLSNQYRDCLLTATKTADPFRKEDDGITRQVMRALNSTGVFLVAVQIGRRVLDGFLDFRPTKQCVNEYMQMQFCSLCGGLTEAGHRPCPGLCEKVLNDCLGDLSGFDAAFNGYLNAATDMITQLENISPEVLIGDLGTRLSFGVMAVYEQLEPGTTLANKVIGLCGRLGGGTRRRSVDELEPNPVKPTPRNHPSDMDLRVQLLFAKESLSLFQSSIGNTANEICYRSSGNADSDCWNGTAMDRYDKLHFVHQQQPHKERKKELSEYIRILQEVTGMMRKWDSVATKKWDSVRNWKVVVNVVDERTDDPLTDEPPTATSYSDCPEDDEECISGSGVSGSGDEEATEGSLSGAQRQYASMTAAVTVVMLTLVYVLQ